MEGGRAGRFSGKIPFYSFRVKFVEPGNEVEDGHSQVMGGVIARGGVITVAVIAPLNEKFINHFNFFVVYIKF